MSLCPAPVTPGSSSITFLRVFLIQNIQDRARKAIRIELEEFIRATDTVSNAQLAMEEVDESPGSVPRTIRSVGLASPADAVA